MILTNRASFPVIAFCFHAERGCGVDVSVEPGQTKEVPGPYLGMMGGQPCHVVVPGNKTCQETPDDKHGDHIAKGEPLTLACGKIGVTVRHHQDAPGDYVTAWRQLYG